MESPQPPILDYQTPQTQTSGLRRYWGDFILLGVVAFDCVLMFSPVAWAWRPVIGLLSLGLLVLLFAAVLWMLMNVVAAIPRRNRHRLPRVLLRGTLLCAFYVILAALIVFSFGLSQY
jgi:hypothetical protein